MPLTDDELSKDSLVQFPTVIGGIDVIVNLPGINPNELKLTGPVLADIYLGKITKWNDKEIAAINPGLKLPSLAIASVHRADGSGTTFVFTDYLGYCFEAAAAFSSARAPERIPSDPRTMRSGLGPAPEAGRRRDSKMPLAVFTGRRWLAG